MEIDWKFLGWFVPLVVGAALTFAFGWLDSTLKARRESQAAAVERERELEDRKRQDAREHAFAALELASRIRDRVTPAPREPGDTRDELYDLSGATWDRDEIRKLRDLGVLIPDEVVREIIADATNFVTASSMVADGCGWEWTPRDIQVRAMVQLREVLGCYLRIEPIDSDTVDWFRRLNKGLEAEWAQYEAQVRAEAAKD